MTTYVVTGGNAGVGYFTAEQLAARGGHVVIAARNLEKAAAAVASIRSQVQDAAVDVVPIDTSSLSSVATAAHALQAFRPDVLILNAGTTDPPRREATTADGLESVLATNFFGHWALTAHLLPTLPAHGRIVGLGSYSTKIVPLKRSGIGPGVRPRPYDRSRQYAASKHAVHGFIYELDRRLRARDDSRLALLAHPGFAVSAFAARRPGITDQPRAAWLAERVLFAAVAQGKDQGAWPTVRAATDPEAQGGEFYGPRDALGLHGRATVTPAVPGSFEPEFGAWLWDWATEQTGVSIDLGD